jgi:hypothetical protein
LNEAACPEDALACHKGDPPIPHGAATCDGGGGGGGDLTNLVLVDATGNVVGPIFNLGNQNAHVIVFTPDQRAFRLYIPISILYFGDGFRETGLTLYYEGSECPDNGATYIAPGHAVPDIFHEVGLIPDGTGGLVPWVGTSFEHPLRTFLSQRNSDGTCTDFAPRITNYYPAEQLTDEFGLLVDDIHDLYPPPFRICAANDIDCITGP